MVVFLWASHNFDETYLLVKPMNILIVDDHAMLRQGCTGLLQTAFPDAHIREADSAESAYAGFVVGHFQLVVMDANLPGMSGLELTTRLLRKQPGLPILFFSMYEETSMVQQALDAGALGYVSKRCEPSVLLNAARSVAAGRRYIDHELSMQLAFRRPSSSSGQGRALPDMTQREFEVFVLLAKGESVNQIADTLSLSSKTISNYSTLLKNKLGVRSSGELVHLAIQSGVIQPGIVPGVVPRTEV